MLTVFGHDSGDENHAAADRRAPPVLVVGHHGQLAQALKSISGAAVSFLCLGRSDGVDITKPQTLREALHTYRPDVVVNAAAYTAVDRAESEAEAAFAINRDGVAELAALSSECEVPLIQISTDYVFDGRKSSPYTEEDPINPLSVYGASKAAGEAAVRQRAGQHVILRTAWLYSKFGSNFVKTILRLAETQDELKVVADQRGCPTAAEDIAAAIKSIVRQIRSGAEPAFGTFHLTGQGVTTWFDFAQAIFALAAARGYRTSRVVPVSTMEYGSAAKRPLNSWLECSRIRQAYGIVLPPWEGSLARVLDLMASRETGA